MFNGWAATAEMWSRCTFRHDRVFSYLEHLSGESLKAVEREEAVILVGFSMGGSFVQEAVLKFPEKIRGVVFVSSTPKMMEAKDEGWAGMSLHRRKALKLGTQMMNPGNPLPEFAEANLDAGLDFLTTQMFFDNNIFYRYLAKLRGAGVSVPVIAGIMPVTNGRQIARICQLSGTALPNRFRAIVDRFGDDPASMLSAGVVYATEQIVDLFANGVTAVHVYTMNRPEVAERIISNLDGIIS